MNDVPAQQPRVRIADLSARKPYRFRISPDAETRAAVAQALDILDVRKLSFDGTLTAKGKAAWRLQANLGATVVQACVLTLAPVTTRIDAPVIRLFTEDYDETITGDDVEMPEDDTIEPLTTEIDLLAIATESLGLALPDYPRAEGAELENSTFSAPNVTPMSDEDVKPFAGLADLKAKLENPDQE